MKLLLVDDDELDRMVVVGALRNSKVIEDIVHATTAVSALKLFEEDTFDVVLLDYRLPDMDCMDILNKLTHHASKHAAVVILTGIGDDEAVERDCIIAGAQDFLLKQELSQRHLAKALVHAQARQVLKQQLMETNAQMKYLAENDSMTGLSNRHYFEDRLKAAIARAQRFDSKVGLLFLDIDNFKLINDSLGHDVGDQILQHVAGRLQEVIREGDILCRLGGDEFAIIVHDLETETSVVILAQRIVDRMQIPITLAKTQHFITCSIGISTYPNCAQSAEDMLKFADLAMYQVKHMGRNGFQFFTEGLQEKVMNKIALEQQLRSGALQSQLVQYYQPVINAADFSVCGAEMLVRWNHPERGILPPGEFLTVVEELGFLSAIDIANMRLACHQLCDWRTSGLVDESFVLAANASEQLIKSDDFQSSLKTNMDYTCLSGENLSIEVTEGVLVADFGKTSEILNQIKTYGVKVAIDDFGTGYSSMAYLKWLPASILKVDRSFVQNVPEIPADCRVLKAIITMAKSLDLDVIVEGVETAAQAKLCREYGADMFQGYLFSPPLPPKEFASFLQQHSPASYVA